MNSSQSDPLPKSKRWRETHALQVQAFLDASDEVDIDEETAEDILQGFDGYLAESEGEDVDIGNYQDPINTLDANIHHDRSDDQSGNDDGRDAMLDALQYEGMPLISVCISDLHNQYKMCDISAPGVKK